MVMASALVALVLLADSLPASANSYTWGYSFQRQRATDAPVAQDAAGVPELDVNTAKPFVAPLPGHSQSSPVVVGDTWYEWTYWDGGRKGALWTGRLNQAQGTSTPGTPVPLPGQAEAILTALPGEHFNDPSDAALSPDGRWVAFGVGGSLYWWPIGHPADGAQAWITGVPTALVSANSTSPTFVPDALSPSGWDVCDGNWNGGFACFQAAQANGVPPMWTIEYLTSWTTPADADGYTAITSSAAYGGPLHDLYFGVASAHDPRVVALNPQTGAFYTMDGGGRVQAPIWASVALDGKDIYATDVDGSAYLFDATTGNLTHELRLYGPTANIVSPAVSGEYLYLVVSGYGTILRLNRHTLRYANFAPARVGGVTQASAITVVDAPGAPTEIFYATTNGGVSIAVPGPAGESVAAGQYTIKEIGGWPGAPAGGAYNWTAAVVDGADVLLWSDGATATWEGQDPPAPAAAAPRGFGPVTGGIQIYRLRPRLTVLVTPAVARVGGAAASLLILAAPGSVVSATGAAWGALQVRPYPDAATLCADRLTAGAGPNFGVFPQGQTPSIGPPAGCGPLATQAEALTTFANSYAGGRQPAYAGLLPSDWQAAGVGYVAWLARVPLPSMAGGFPITVTATLPDGNRSQERVWLTSTCPVGVAADQAGHCSVDMTPTPNAWSPNPPPGADRCPPSIAPGIGGMTQQEFDLFCKPLEPWLTDQQVIDCYGSWWNWINHAYVRQACVMTGRGRYVGG